MNKDFFKGFIDDVRVELMDEFDRNFERKAFFDQPWAPQRHPNRRGSLLMRSGALRRSLKASSGTGEVRFSSSLPYASIQNDGGVITVTVAMKKFFWAMYYKASGASRGTGARAIRFSIEADYWKGLALKKVGSKIRIQARTFIGDHPQVDQAVERVLGATMQKVSDELYKTMKP